MKISYKQKLFFAFFILFTFFAGGVVIFEQARERKFRTELLKEKLDTYATIVENGNQLSTFPENLRLTLIDWHGNVIYDNAVDESVLLKNHADRPEILQAKESGRGSDIRISTTNNQKYFYYAKRDGDSFIRVALPYDIQMQKFLKSDNFFLYYLLLLFVITILFINYLADRYSNSIKKLRNFAYSDNSQLSTLNSQFPDDELGEISKQIIDNYEQLQESKKKIAIEREKLLQHVHSSGEGLCFFSSNKKAEFYNGLFIQYLNTITDESTSNPAILFSDPIFKSITDFLSNREKGVTYFETQIHRQGKFFNLQVNVFEDNSFEVNINDITKQEKTRLLKQEMTSNIAHELRTPVTSIRGYLEIALNQPVDKETVNDFLTKAYQQTIVLSELIRDMSLITKIEEAPVSFNLESVKIENLLESLKNDLAEQLSEKNINIAKKNLQNIVIQGNPNLIYSIFRNLTENAIRYAGNNINITISKYNEDRNFYYFSYADTGIGIADEHHLNRLFERFYRVNEGRTRDTGGSGLGLSIVKNAILFHKGTIAAKNRAGGGLEFLFKLPKILTQK
jgi:signal transduction histidine kinase